MTYVIEIGAKVKLALAKEPWTMLCQILEYTPHGLTVKELTTNDRIWINWHNIDFVWRNQNENNRLPQPHGS